MVILKVSILVVLLFRASNGGTKVGGAGEEAEYAAPEYISSISTTYFGHCSRVILLRDGSPNLSGPWEKSVRNQQNLHVPTYAVTLTRSSSVRFFKHRHPYGHHTFFTQLGPTGRHRKNCGLALLFLGDTAPAKATLLTEFLTPKHWEILKRDEDHFIFVSPPSKSKEILLSSFASKVKFKILIPMTSTSLISLKTVCFYCDNGRPSIAAISLTALSTQSMKNAVKISQIFPDMTHEFNGYELVVANSEKTFQRGAMTLKDGKYEPVSGLYFLVLYTVLKPYMNFTVKLIHSYGDRGPGLQLPNGTWLGAVADVLHGRAHLGMTMCQSVQRRKVIDFAFSIAYEWITFSVGKPAGKFSWKAIYRPFELSSWILLGVSFITTTIAITMVTSHSAIFWSIPRIAQFMVGAFLEQSCKANDFRWLAFSWILFALIMRTAYRSKMFGFLVFPSVQPTPQDFKELASSEEYTWGLNFLGGAAYAIFASSQEATYKHIFDRMELLNDTYECYEKAVTSKFACIAWRSFADHLRVKNFTDSKGRSALETAKEYTYFVPCGWGLETRAIFKANFDRVLHTGHDSGLIHKWEEMDEYAIKKRRWNWEKSMNDSNLAGFSNGGYNGEETRPLKLKSLRGGIYFCGTLVLLAGVAFVLEEFCVLVKSVHFDKVKVLNTPKGNFPLGACAHCSSTASYY